MSDFIDQNGGVGFFAEQYTPDTIYPYIGGDRDMRPWVFKSDSGWTNTSIQIGYTLYPIISEGSSPTLTISGLDNTSDGTHYLKCNLAEDKYEIVVVAPGEETPESKPEKDLIYFWIGEIKNGMQVAGIYQTPIVYKYV